MTRVAIVGGGISGLTAAYELEQARGRGAALDWQLYEASDRLGGIVETTRLEAADGEYILEGGPDGWVSEKPWARQLAIELGLGDDLISSNDATRRTYILRDAGGPNATPQLLPIPDGMRLMVPTSVDALEGSPLFTAGAREAYAAERTRSEALQATALDRDGDGDTDESVAAFVRRHFGEDVLTTLAAPLLAGIFGGDVEKLSVRAVMPQFVALEREYGSLIAGLQAKAQQRGSTDAQPVFTSLGRGMASLVEALAAALPAERIHFRCMVEAVWDDPRWQIVMDDPAFRPNEQPQPLWVDRFDHVVVAAPLDAARNMLLGTDAERQFQRFLPQEASSAVLVTFTWPATRARTFDIPSGFGFLVPPAAPASGAMLEAPLLACTFADQKFPRRAPVGARVLRAFFGGASAAALAGARDEDVARVAWAQLEAIFGTLPTPEHTLVRRWPRSLPQFEVGHLARMAQLEALLAETPGLHLLGNSYHGVGLPDLVREARAAARRIADAAS